MGHNKRGFALAIVLFFLALLSCLVIGLSENTLLSKRHAVLMALELKGLNAADAGVAFALESIRQSSGSGTVWWTTVSPSSAPWILVEAENGNAVCFKAFPEAPPNSRTLSISSYGEVVKGNCGDYSAQPEAILSAKILSAGIDLTPGEEKVVRWQEVTP